MLIQFFRPNNVTKYLFEILYNPSSVIFKHSRNKQTIRLKFKILFFLKRFIIQTSLKKQTKLTLLKLKKNYFQKKILSFIAQIIIAIKTCGTLAQFNKQVTNKIKTVRTEIWIFKNSYRQVLNLNVLCTRTRLSRYNYRLYFFRDSII